VYPQEAKERLSMGIAMAIGEGLTRPLNVGLDININSVIVFFKNEVTSTVGDFLIIKEDAISGEILDETFFQYK